MVSMNIFGFILPITIVIMCYIMILFYLKKHSKYIKGDKHSVAQNRTYIESSFSNKTNNLSNSGTCQEIENLSQKDSIRMKKTYTRFMVELKITKKTLLVIISFCLAWMPYALVSLVAQFSLNRQKYITPNTTIFPSLMTKSSSIVNPIIYILSNNNFRKRLRKLFSRYNFTRA
jgi:hypothetical protein